MQKYWILIRGLVRGAGHWADFPEQLQAAFPGDEIEMLDIPGNGTRCQESSPLSMEAMVKALREQSSFVREGRRVHIIAISMGAMVAAEWAEKHPDEVESLVLINSSSAKQSKFYERLQPQNYPRIAYIFAGRRGRLSVEDIEREVLKMTLNSSERREFALPIWTAESTAHPISAMNFFRQLWAASSYVFPGKPPVPTKMLACENDHFVSVSCSKTLAKNWNCPIYFHPWAGHDLTVDDPEWVINKLRTI